MELSPSYRDSTQSCEPGRLPGDEDPRWEVYSAITHHRSSPESTVLRIRAGWKYFVSDLLFLAMSGELLAYSLWSSPERCFTVKNTFQTLHVRPRSILQRQRRL